MLINTRVTSEERERIRLAARANFKTVSEFMRDAVTNAASETLEEPSEDDPPN